jgi:hypothetical protein
MSVSLGAPGPVGRVPANVRKGNTVSEPASNFDELMTRLEGRKATLGIMGLGYVGVPLALAGIEAGFNVLGFDVSTRRVAAINGAEQVISYIGEDVMKAAIASGRLEATSDFTRLKEADAILICVPTPVTKHRDPGRVPGLLAGARGSGQPQLLHQVDPQGGGRGRSAVPRPGGEAL